MRTTHKENPMHKIQRWTSTHFRSAQLWEVGTYILVPHSSGQPLCETLQFQKSYLEIFEQQKDDTEQQNLGRSAPVLASAPPPWSPKDRDQSNEPEQQNDDRWMWDQPSSHEVEGTSVPISESAPGTASGSARGWGDHGEGLDDARFDQYLEDLYQRQGEQEQRDKSTFFTEPDDNATVEDADADVAGLPRYLAQDRTTADHDHAFTNFDLNAEHGSSEMPTADAFNNSYVRIVHTNGIHHLAMVSCRCRGADMLPRDLVACRLLPASFQTIRTLFSAQVLDTFRLCNLELKASAYQFYQLLRRLTMPMAPAQVVDLYNEFQRMSRLWRWMKKLKWAGFGHNGKIAMNVDRGELANYCPACPQPSINLPDNWKDDPNR